MGAISGSVYAPGRCLVTARAQLTKIWLVSAGLLMVILNEKR